MPQGIDTPVVDKLTWGDETPGAATEGEGVTREDERGGKGTENPPPPNQARRSEPMAAMRSWRAV